MILQKRRDKHAESKNHDVDLCAGITLWIIRHVGAEVSSNELIVAIPRGFQALALPQPVQLDLQLHDFLLLPQLRVLQLLLPLHKTLNSLDRFLVFALQFFQFVIGRLYVLLHVAQFQHQLLPRLLLTFQFAFFIFYFLNQKIKPLFRSNMTQGYQR